MRRVRERRRHASARPELLEIVTPRTNAAIVTPVENLLAAIALSEPFSLEIAATETTRRFLARAQSPAMRRHLTEQLAVAYPQAELRPLDTECLPDLDPARRAPDEQAAICTLRLRRPPYLPLRTFGDAEIDADRRAQADPVLGILGALADLPVGGRGLAQLVLRPAPEDWCNPYLRLAIERPLAAERAATQTGAGGGAAPLAALLVAGVLGLQGYHWYAAHAWLHLSLLATGVVTGGSSLAWLWRRFTDRPTYDPALVREKVSRPAFQTELRLAVFAPAAATRQHAQARLDRLVSAYRQFTLAAGNSFVACRQDPGRRDLCTLAPLGSRRMQPVLTTRELAGLWHLPQAQADVPLLERTTARRRLPLPADVAGGCHIGVSSHQGRSVAVALPEDLLRRHLLLVAKTRRGKSSLLLRLARHAMESRPAGVPATVVLVDPHRDLAHAALGLVPPSRQRDVVFLDVAQRARPFGLNLLDAGLFDDRDKAVANALAVFRREFNAFWGPRMEDAFRFALLTLCEANRAICTADPGGRARQHTILDVPPVLVDAAFRGTMLGHVADPIIRHWWTGYFDRLDRRLQVEVSNPVATKVQRYAGSTAARAIVGQPCSTIDPRAWLRDGAIVVIDTAKGSIGADTAALVGATLLNVVALAVAEQAAVDPSRRRPVVLLVDEFHAMPGADYEAILAELAKCGANLVLATQSLATLAALDRDQERALRATVFANLDGLFAFHCSAEDARALVPELGGEIDEHDLVSLGEHQCYARISARGERLPVFSVRLDPPPASDPGLAAELAAASALRYGRDAVAVDRDLQAAMDRIDRSHRPLHSADPATVRGAGTDQGEPHVAGRQAMKPKKARNDHRGEPESAKPVVAEVRQETLPDLPLQLHPRPDRATTANTKPHEAECGESPA